jgi:T5SS/PEP-CTERM-associated repeat protein
VYVGGSAGSHGTVTVDGGNSRLASSDLTVGLFGSGELHISAAGVVNTPQAIALGLFQGSSGIITIDGANSRLSGSSSLSSQSITVGKAGTGRLDITHGGSLSAPAGILTIGADKGSSGIVTVSGPGSQLTVTPNGTPTVIVGQNGIGTLNGSNGATIYTGSAYVGMKSGSSPATGSGAVTLDGRGTVWNAVGPGGTSFIGRSESGSVKITNGAEFSTAQTFLGYSAGGVGTAEVTGTGSRWALNSNLTLGENGGTGTLSISGGGQVAVTGPNSVTINPGSSIDIHQATLSASTINTAGALINDGTITGNVKVYVGGTLSGSGTISGQLSVLGGNISPGDSPGMQTAGDVAFNSATYQFEINSASGIAGGPIGWDLLKSQTSATLAGITTVHLVSLDQANDPGNLFDFNPALDYHWTFLTSSTGISGFDAASFLIDTSGFTNPIGGHFTVSQVGNSLQLNYLVPEPSSFVLAGAALASLFILARQKAGRTKHNSRKRLSRVGG